MKNTRANVEEYAKSKGYTPVQIDGIPEGFSFIEPDIQIGPNVHEGEYVAFIPNKELIITAQDIPNLLQKYLKNAK